MAALRVVALQSFGNAANAYDVIFEKLIQFCPGAKNIIESFFQFKQINTMLCLKCTEMGNDILELITEDDRTRMKLITAFKNERNTDIEKSWYIFNKIENIMIFWVSELFNPYF